MPYAAFTAAPAGAVHGRLSTASICGRRAPRVRVRVRVRMAADGNGDGEAAPTSAPTPAKWIPKTKVKSTASWANVYIEDFGRKGTGSRLDVDLRPASERGAEGGICPDCNGTGITTCMLCDGLPFIMDGNVIPCPACDDKHQVECSSCGGTGKQVELTDGWWEKGIAQLYEEAPSPETIRARAAAAAAAAAQ